MRWSDVTTRPSARVLRQFALACLLGCTLSAAWQGVLRGRPLLAALLGLSGLVFVLAGLTRPKVLGPLYTALLVLVFPAGWLLTNLVLALLFYLVVTPLGLLFRLAGRDVLDRHSWEQKESYWQEKAPVHDTGSYFRTF